MLHDVALDVPVGAWMGLIGPNGAGKSTLLGALSGTLPFEGTIEVDGVPLRRMSPRRRARRIAVVEQLPVRPPEMTVADYVLLGRTPHITYFGREGAGDRAVVGDTLVRLDLAGLAGRPVDSLSGGEWQRAVIARALAQGPDVLLLDEPTSALDVGRQLHVLELLDGLRHERGLTVVSATHDLGLAAAYCDRLALMSRGGVVVQGAPREVITEAVLNEHYDARLRVVDDGAGHIAVVPHRDRRG
ncbi:MAG: ABC transporter ATP-binding protein [Thermoleophilia bacterium]